MITIHDIAKEAGVSSMTVSNVVNGHHKKVSQKTLEKVTALIEKYNYVPNSAARSLSAKNSKIIALCIADNLLQSSEMPNYFESPYNSDLIGIIQYFVEKNGYYLMLCGGNNYDAFVNFLKTWKVEGALFFGGFDSIITQLLENTTIPLFFLDSYYTEGDVPNVGIDDFKGGYLATKHLIEKGHRRIAFVSNLEKPNILLERRFSGYLNALKENHIKFTDDLQINQPIGYQGGINAGKLLSELDATAAFCTADIMAIGIMEGLRLCGKSVPDDLSLIGFDDIPTAEYVTPKLTTIHQPFSQKGELAVKQLFHLIQKQNDITNIPNTLMPIQLVERQSVKEI
jgi:LacI family transcriptional regulator